MELGPEDVSLLERCPHFRGWYVQTVSCVYLDRLTSQTAAVVQLWRKEKVERGLITIEQKKSETKEV